MKQPLVRAIGVLIPVILLATHTHGFLVSRGMVKTMFCSTVRSSSSRNSHDDVRQTLTTAISKARMEGDTSDTMGVVASEAGAEVEDATETVHGDPFGTISALSRINRSLDSIKRNVNWLVDRVVRKSAAEELGEVYIESGQADSIERLLYFLPDEQLSTGEYAGQKLERALALAEAIATTLVEERVPERLLECIAAKVQLPQAEGSSARAWVVDGGRVDREALDAFLTVCEDAPLRQALQKLRRVVTMEDAKEKTELLTYDSAGMMCLVAAAHSTHYLNTSNTATSFILPPDKLWFDMKGDLWSNGRASGYASASVIPCTASTSRARLSTGAARPLSSSAYASGH